ncbi:hypothetical protein D3C87_1620810 [compost metagenome]
MTVVSLDLPDVSDQAGDSFYRFLERFPGTLMADLNAATMKLYKEFNRFDGELGADHRIGKWDTPEGA